MSEEYEKFNERFETIEQALKYVADSQAKTEFANRKNQVEWKKNIEEMRQINSETQRLQQNTQNQLDYITKVVRFLVEDNETQNGKLVEAGNILSRK